MRCICSFGFLLALTGCVSTGSAGADAGSYAYIDMLRPRGVGRSAAAGRTAARLCDGGDPGLIGSAKFDACMRGRGWKVARLAPSQGPGYAYDWSSASSSADVSSPSPSPDTSAADTQAMVQSEIAAQQQNDAANAATVQTEYNFNIMYNNNP